MPCLPWADLQSIELCMYVSLPLSFWASLGPGQCFLLPCSLKESSLCLVHKMLNKCCRPECWRIKHSISVCRPECYIYHILPYFYLTLWSCVYVDLCGTFYKLYESSSCVQTQVRHQWKYNSGFGFRQIWVQIPWSWEDWTAPHWALVSITLK